MFNYKFSDRKLYLPQVRDVYVYIDDGGSMGMDYVGFTAMMIDEFTSRLIEQKVRELCEKYNISELHAKDLKFTDRELTNMQEYENVYRGLFEILIHELKRANFEIVLGLLASKYAFDAVQNIHFEIFGGVTDNLRYRGFGEKYKNFYSYFAFPTIEILRRIEACDGNISIKVCIDRKNDFDTYAKEMTSLSGSLVSELLEVRQAAINVINSYIRNVLKNNCKIDSFDVFNGRKHPLIAAVDGISNFLFNFVKCLVQGLENSSETEKLKYNVFRDFYMDDSEFDSMKSTIQQNFKLDGNRIVCLSNKPISFLEVTQKRS